MPQRIRVREINTVGFVEQGDDPEAQVVLLKRKDDGEGADMEKADKVSLLSKLTNALGGVLGLDAEGVGDELSPSTEKEVEMADYKREDLPQEAQDELQKLEDEKDALQALLDAVPEPDEDVEEKDEEVEEEIPEAVAKALETAEKRAEAAEAKISKLEDEKRLATYQDKAAQFKHLPEWTVDDFGSILGKIAEVLDTGEFDRMEKMLKGANEAIRQSVLLEEIGGGGSGYGSKEAEVDALAKAAKQADPKLSEDLARAKVLKDNPKLLAEVLKETETMKKG